MINYDKLIEDGKLGTFINNGGGILWVSADFFNFNCPTVSKVLEIEYEKQRVSQDAKTRF